MEPRNPFPATPIRSVAALSYVGELKFVRHASTSHGERWQLSADFGALMCVQPKFGLAYNWEITAPRGMYTDLASVPKLLWSIAGPIGHHLEVSIIHDYLYMAWTDHYAKARQQDWEFADKVFLQGMKVSGVGWLRRHLMYGTVRSPIGWGVFKHKPATLTDRMAEWLPGLNWDHERC